MNTNENKKRKSKEECSDNEEEVVEIKSKKQMTIKDLYKQKQKKKASPNFKVCKINLDICIDKPTIRVMKKYMRFHPTAGKNGWLKYPVGDFEVYDVCSGGRMNDLSPMILGPVIDEFGDEIALNIEDGWQGSKVWSMHMNGGQFDEKKKLLWKDGLAKLNPDKDSWIPEWKKWNKHICFSGEAARHRVKIKKDDKSANKNVPLFSYYHGKRYSYEKARKLMYIRWYAKLVQQTKSFKYLKERFDAGTSLVLLDFDGQPRDQKDILINLDNEKAHKYMETRINDPNEIFGHGFVLACVLAGIDVWSDEKF